MGCPNVVELVLLISTRTECVFLFNQVYGPGAVDSLMNLQMLETLAVNGCRGMSDPTVKQLRQELPCLKHVRGL